MNRTEFRLPAFLLILFGLTLQTAAQDLTVTGTVTDAATGESLIGVNIYAEDNRMRGTASDFDGSYSIAVDRGTRLVFRYVGFRDTTFLIKSSQSLHVAMESAAMDLNTVVVSASRRKEKILDAPAAVSVITSDKLEKKAAVNVQDHLKNVSGVHIIKSGIQGGTPTVRGFGGYYSSHLMTLVDNRSAQVPNFRLNAYNLISTTSSDLERVEVLKGPASALYGPNTSEGVVHMITRSPIDHQETRFSVGVGFRTANKDTLKIADGENPRFDSRDAAERLIGTLEFRHADTISLKRRNLRAGYKVSAGFFRGLDWKYNDPNDPETVVKYIPTSDGIIPLDGTGQPLSEEEIAAGATGEVVDNERNETINKVNIDSRFDLRIGDDLEIVLAGGFNVSDGIDMTPIGGLQQDGWKYAYWQARLLWRNFFVQAYSNFSNSGDSYYLPTGGILIDKSKYHAAQLQHYFEPRRNLKFIYGVDAFFTRVETEATLNGRYEDEDDINEVGAYFQGEYVIHPKLSVIAASRADWHNQIRKVFLSPRAALLFKPGTGQNVRVTFNRAFRTPGASAYFVDVRQAEFPTGIGIRALGTSNDGFQYQYAANPYFENDILPQFRSPFAEDPYAYYHVGDNSLNNAGWQGILDAIKSELPKQFGLTEPIDALDALLDDMIAALLPSELDDVDQVIRDFNATFREFQPSDWKNLQDIEKLKPVTTHTYEIGYKGVIANFLMLSIDGYKTDHFNYIAPVTFVTPGVLLNADQVLDQVAPVLQANLQDPDNDVYNQLLLNLLDRNESLGGNNNGDASDELAGFIHQAVSSLPIGTITPQQASGSEMLLVTRNIGDVSVYGLEAGLSAWVSKDLRLDTWYSWVDKDSIPVEGAQFGYVALNAPKHRFSIGGSYHIAKVGLDIGARFNWQAGFPANSGNFVGRVPAYHEMDLDIAWVPPAFDQLQLTLSVSNLYNNFHQHFIGSPEIGMMTMVKASYVL